MDTAGLIWDCPKPSILIQIIAIIPLLTSLPPSLRPSLLPSSPTFLPAALSGAHASFLHQTSTPTPNQAALASLHRRTVNDHSQQILESLFLSAPIYVALDHLSVAKVTATVIIPGSVVYTGKDIARTRARLCLI